MSEETIKVAEAGHSEPKMFIVTIAGRGPDTVHNVTLSRSQCERLAGGTVGPETVVEAAFRFLLEREPKESIMERFDLPAIAQYFPEFELELARYLKVIGAQRRADPSHSLK